MNRAILAKRTQFSVPMPHGESRDFGQTNPIFGADAARRIARFWPNEPNLPADAERRTARFWPNEPNLRAAAERRKQPSELALHQNPRRERRSPDRHPGQKPL